MRSRVAVTLLSLLTATLVAAAVPGAPGTAAPYTALRVDQAALLARIEPAGAADLSADAPPTGARATPVRLPLRLHRDDGNALGVFWLRMDLPGLAALPAQPAIFVPRLTDGGVFYLNGTPVLSIPAADALKRVRWRRARAFALPPALLLPEGNRLELKIVNRDYTVDVPYLLLGSERELQAEAEARQWVDQYGSQFTGVTALIVGGFILSIWWYRRSERYYLLFGVSSLLWALRTLNYSIEVMPAESWWWWRAGHFFVVAAATATLAAFFLEYAGIGYRRWVLPVALHAVAGPIAIVASDGRWHEFVYRWWQGPLFLVIGAALVAFARWGHRTRSVDALLITIGVVLATVLAANDYATVSGLLPPTRIYTLHLALPVLLVTIGALLTVRFVRALRIAEGANAVLAERLAAKERELAEHYGRLALVERREASTAERQRIMHDMHDGLGAQLVSSLVVVERGNVQAIEVARMLREAIDEMRLAIDAFGRTDTDLEGALASLRHRMEPRLQAAGIALDWSLDNAFASIRPNDESALQLLRFVQEALANAIRHSRASRVGVRFAVESDRCRVTISDNGVGIDAARPPGRGLPGMRRRARVLGGEVQVDSAAGGTTLTLRFPVPRSVAA
jgi:signal transduction histidine kinase